MKFFNQHLKCCLVELKLKQTVYFFFVCLLFFFQENINVYSIFFQFFFKFHFKLFLNTYCDLAYIYIYIYNTVSDIKSKIV